MEDYNNKTKAELLEIIQNLEKKVEQLSSESASGRKERFRDRYSNRILDNLPDMLRAASAFPEYQLVLAGAPGISPDYYHEYVGDAKVKILFGQTYRLLQQAEAALVTSGTATLETALFRVPQVVCYYTPIGKVVSFLRRHILTVKFMSLVNLIADREVVKELVADTMTVKNMQNELKNIIENEAYRNEMLLELAFEGKRWWDLVRFDKAFDLVPSLREHKGEDYMMLFPIPLSTISVEPKVTQNPGWDK